MEIDALKLYRTDMLFAACVVVLLLGFDILLQYAFPKKRKQPSDKTSQWFIACSIFAITWLVLYALNNHEFVGYNNYSYLSEALLNGKIDCVLPDYLESIELGGKEYMHFAPGVSFILLPLVAIFGVSGVNYAYVGFTLGAGNAVLFYFLLCNLKIGKTVRERLLCTLLAIFGTVHCFLAAVAHSWFIGHVASWFCLFAAGVLLTCPYRDKKRAAVAQLFAGLFFGLAVCCRLSNLLGAPVFIAYILLYRPKKEWLWYGIPFMLGAAVFGGAYMWMNYTRFGTIMDKSYNLTHLKDFYKPLYYYMQEELSDAKSQMTFLNAVEKMDWETAFPTVSDKLRFIQYLQDRAGEGWNYCTNVPTYVLSDAGSQEITDTFYSIVQSSFPSVEGPLGVSHLPWNLETIFWMMPKKSDTAPYIYPSITGVSITAISPALYFCLVPLWTRRKKPMTWVALGTMVLTAIPFLLNYGNGTVQFGARYAMDFLPYMILLACVGLTEHKFRCWKTALILFCVLANVWGPIYWRYFVL